MAEVARYQINGVIDTANSVLANIETIANAACSWVSYDNMTGKWAVVINRPGVSVKSFDDNNIIGDITLTTTNLNELYNRVEVTFPHRDIDDAQELVAFDLPTSERWPNEQDNTLSINLDLVNEPVQAQAIGMIELKQNRRDKIVTFASDFSSVGLQPGDIIDISNQNFAWANKLFRIVTVSEQDSEQGIILEFTALEYTDDVYDISDIERFSPPEEAIVSAGAIGRMGAPSFSIDSVSAQSTVTSRTPIDGSQIETVEFWVYVVPATEDVANTDDNTRTYRLLTTVTPTDGGTYAPDSDVTAIVQLALSRTILVKARARNRLALGPFSDYTAIDFQGLGDLSRNGVMISEVYGIFADTNLYPIMYNTVVDPSVLSNYQMVINFDFTPRQSGEYMLKHIFQYGTDLGAGSLAGGRGPLLGEGYDYIGALVTIIDAQTNTVLGTFRSDTVNNTGSGSQNISLFANLIAGRTYIVQGYALTFSTPPTNFDFATVRYNYTWILEYYTVGAGA